MAGIIGYGLYIPKYRIEVSEIAKMWQKDPLEIASGLKVKQKSVPGIDEDTVTISIEAGKRAISMAGIKASVLQAVYIGSESHPYAVNPTSTTVAEYLGVGNDYFAADLEFACKAGTAGMQVLAGLLSAKEIDYGLTIGADAAQGKPHDALEYTAASAGAAYILGKKKAEIIADILCMSSFSSDTPDFWRREGQKYPSHFGRFTGEPAYFTHVAAEGNKLLVQSKLNPRDFDYCVFHMPNGKFPRIVAKKLGFTPEQLAPSLTVDSIGNPYSASSLVGLGAVLDIAKPNQKIFFVSYGSGAGSDGFVFETTKNLLSKRGESISFAKETENTMNISYSQYLKQTHSI